MHVDGRAATREIINNSKNEINLWEEQCLQREAPSGRSSEASLALSTLI
jgi:hypothetical protein